MEARVFEHGADLGARMGELAIAQAVEPGRPGVRVDEPEQDPQRGALARSIGAEEAGDSPRFDRERQAGHGLDGAEVLADLLYLDCGHGGTIDPASERPLYVVELLHPARAVEADADDVEARLARA